MSLIHLSFSVQINFWKALNDWYTDKLNGRMHEGFNQNWITQCVFATFNVTNTSIYNHCFDCNILWCCLCCVCWCFSAPCYKVTRSRVSSRYLKVELHLKLLISQSKFSGNSEFTLRYQWFQSRSSPQPTDISK